MTNAADDQPTRQSPSAPDDSADSSPHTSGAAERHPHEIIRRTSSVDGMVQEIRAQLAGLSAHEIDLRRREDTIQRERHRLEQAARTDAQQEFEQARRQLTSKAGLLNAQATAIVAQRRRLDTLTRQLDDRETGLRQREQDLEQRAARLQRRAEQISRRLQTRRRTTSKRIAVVRSAEQKLNRRFHAARAEIVRGRDELQRLRDENESRATQFAKSKADVQARAETVQRQTEQAARQLAQARRALEEAASRRANLQQQQQQVEGEHAALRAARGVLNTQREQLQRERGRLQQRESETATHRAELEAAAERLTAREDNLRRQHEELKRRAAHVHRRVSRLGERFRFRREVLRKRIHIIRAREEELARRLQSAREEITHQRDQTLRLQADADARESEAAAAEERLHQRREDVEQHVRDVAARHDAVERQARLLEQEGIELARQRLKFQQAAHTIELEQKRLDQQRAERQREEAAFSEERERLERARAALRDEQDAAAENQSRLEHERRSLQQTADTLATEQTRVAQAEEELTEAHENLGRERDALAHQEEELSQRWQALRAQDQQLARQREELDTRRRGLQETQSATDQRTERLTARERRLREKLDALEANTIRLAELEAELAGRQTEIDGAHRRVEELERLARARHDEALTLREQAESRDNESRQAALAHELETQELTAERERLEAAQAELDDWRGRREQELNQVRASLAQRAGQLLEAQRSVLAAPRRWWLRSTGLAITAGVLVWFLWLWSHPSMQRATVNIQVTATRPTRVSPDDAQRWSQRILSEHSRELLDPHLLAEGPAAMQSAWELACARRQVEITTDPEQMSLHLQVIGTRTGEAGRLVRAAAERYAERVNRVPADEALPTHFDDLAAWQAELRQTLDARRAERTADTAALAALPASSERQEATTAADRLSQQLTDVAQTLADARSALAVLLAAEAPAGTVDPAAIEAALRLDAVYREDRREFHAAAEKFRTELAIGMVKQVGPAQAVHQTLTVCTESIAEQQGLDPPPALVAVLEGCAADAGRATRQLSSFTTQWREAVETVQRMDVSEDRVESAVVELVQRHSDAAASARRMADDAVRIVDEMGARIETLATAGDGSTREVVVAAVLRSDHVALKTAVEDLLQATEKIALVENVELDTHDRQLRGLRMRLDQRRELVTQRLQLDADRLARQRHNVRVEQARNDVLELEERRETQVVKLVGTLERLRELDFAARRRAAIVARIEQHDEAVMRLEAELANLERKLTDVRRAGTAPDRIQLGRTIIEPIAHSRHRDAAIAGGGTLTAVWLLCVLMVLKAPWRRKTSGLEEIIRSAETKTAGGAT